MAGLLDIFTIAFQSDGLKEFETELKRNEAELARYEKQVAETEKKMKSLADEGKSGTVEYKKLETQLKQAQSNVKLFGDSVSRLKGTPQASVAELKGKFSQLAGTVAKIATVGIAIKKALDFAEQGQQLEWLAQKAGTTAEKLSTIGNAAKVFGGTTESAAGTMAHLRSQYQGLLMGEGGGGLEQALFKYGVALSADPEKMLENVAKRMEAMKSDAAKWDLAETLGIDEGTTRLLMQGLDKYRSSLERASKYKLYTKDDINRMREYQQISSDIRMGIDSIFGSIYRAMLPALMEVAKVIRGITDWLATHSGAAKILATLAAVAVGIMSVTSGIRLLNGAFKLLSMNPAFLMWTGIVVAITAFIAVIQDLYTWINGGEAVFGKFYQSVADTFGAIWEFIKDFWDGFTDVPAASFEWLFEKIDEIKEAFSQLRKYLNEVWNNLGDGIKAAFQGIVEWIKQKIAALVDFLPDKAKEWLGLDNFTVNAEKTAENGNYISPWDVAAKGQTMLAYANQSPLNSTPAGAITSYYSTQSQNQTTIDNTRTLTNNKSNSLVIQNMTVETQAANAEEFYNGLQTMTAFDNGLQ